jgi:hypothetical protein
MSSVRIVFRPDLGDSGAVMAARGEVFVWPRSRDDRSRLDIANLVLEKGLEALEKGEGPIDCVVIPAGRLKPTLDEMLAAAIAIRLASGQAVPSGMKAFADYAAIARKGRKAGQIPIESSLEGIFLAIRNSVGEDLTNPKEATQFLARWSRLFDRIMFAAEKTEDPFRTLLFDEGSEFADERTFLVEDRRIYRQDVSRGERWTVRLPGGPPTAAALVLDRPKSLLFKYWSRIDGDAHRGDGYLFLAVDWGDGQWVFSTNPVDRLSLKPLAQALQESEQALDPVQAPKDPWFDGDRFAYTLVASPKRGTRLSNKDVLRIVKRWSHAKPMRLQGRTRALTAAAAILAALTGISWAMHTRTGTAAANSSEDPPDHNSVVIKRETNPPMPRVGPTPVSDPSRKGTLYVLAVGISHYQDRDSQLKLADTDAQALAEAFRQEEGPFFTVATPVVLLNDEAKKDKIETELEALADEARSPDDFVVVILAGHGAINSHGTYFFLPWEYDPAKALRKCGINWDDFSETLKDLPCMALVILDTCHSGAVTRRGSEDKQLQGVISDFKQAQKGVLVLAACLSRDTVEEPSTWPHAALSGAVLEAVTGKRIFSPAIKTSLPGVDEASHVVTLESLRSYVLSRVAALTKGTKSKQKVIPGGSGDVSWDSIPIARRTVSSPNFSKLAN